MLCFAEQNKAKIEKICCRTVVGHWAPCSASAHAALQVACRRDGKIRWPRRPGLPAAHQRLSFLFFFLFACLCVARPPRAICPRHRPRPPERAAAVTTSHNPVSVSRVSPPARAGSRACVVGRRAPCTASAHAALQVAGRRGVKIRWPRRPERGSNAARCRLSVCCCWNCRCWNRRRCNRRR